MSVMICEKCKQENKTSTVTQQGGQTTLCGYFSFYDEDGKYHLHDENIASNSYSCSNGHKWFIGTNPPCQTCNFDWLSDEQCKANSTPRYYEGDNEAPIRQEITVIPADKPSKLRLGWVVHEKIGEFWFLP